MCVWQLTQLLCMNFINFLTIHNTHTHTYTHNTHSVLISPVQIFPVSLCHTLNNKNNNNKQRAKSLLPATRDESSVDSGEDDEAEEEEEEAEEQEEVQQLEAERAADQSNCLHCGEQHNEVEMQQEEAEPESPADNGTDQQLTLSDNAQTCDILDHNLYLRRMFVMPNSSLMRAYCMHIVIVKPTARLVYNSLKLLIFG